MNHEKAEKPRRSKVGTAVFAIVVAVLVGVAGYAGYNIFKIVSGYQEAAASYDKIAALAGLLPDGGEQADAPSKKNAVKFAKLKKENSDIVAWISSKGTVINYPVVQTDNNDFYLNHLFDKQWNCNGCPFLDKSNSPNFTDDNTVIYGHHMDDGSMFASIVNYKDQSYYEDHPKMRIDTPDRSYELQLFAGCVLKNSEDALKLRFAKQKNFEKWVDDMRSQSYFKSSVKVGPKDRVVTLYTCTYDFQDAKFTLFGVLRPLD